MEKIKVIIKKPGEPVGHWKEVENTLEALQGIVGGNIQVLYARNFLLIMNEEGKNVGLPINFNLFDFKVCIDIIVGTAIVVGCAGEEFADCPLTMEEWKDTLLMWGNTIRGAER